MAEKANSLPHTKWMCKYHIVFLKCYNLQCIAIMYNE